jgi:hypothetical protein
MLEMCHINCESCRGRAARGTGRGKIRGAQEGRARGAQRVRGRAASAARQPLGGRARAIESSPELNQGISTLLRRWFRRRLARGIQRWLTVVLRSGKP